MYLDHTFSAATVRLGSAWFSLVTVCPNWVSRAEPNHGLWFELRFIGLTRFGCLPF